jgi:hypothetical protein
MSETVIVFADKLRPVIVRGIHLSSAIRSPIASTSLMSMKPNVNENVLVERSVCWLYERDMVISKSIGMI